MAITSALGVLDTLRRTQLLDPVQLDELTCHLKARPVEARALAGELICRGWLTPYQINQLFQGRADDLVLGHYQLLQRLGEGGMGQVFKARETRLGRIVALKVLRKEQITRPETIRRFHKEIEAAARLSHPNIVHAYDAEQIGDTHVYAMEFIEGIDLARLVQSSGPLPVPQACEYVRQVALGLQHIHEHGMVHRDIKPANLMRAGSEGTIKILDMGLARLLDEDADPITKLTRLGTVMGTIDYIAPEQALSSQRADIRSDLYSLGCSFFFLLTGRVPFPIDEPLAKLLAHQHDPPPPVQQLRPDVPPHVAAVVARLMAKNPEDRHQTPAELVLELASFAAKAEMAPSQPSGGRQPPERSEPQGADAPRSEADAPRSEADAPRSERPPSAPRRRSKFWIATAVVLAPLMIGLLVHLLRGDRQPALERGVANTSGAMPSGSVITNSLGMRLVRIPAGSFFIGSPANEPHHRRDEEPSHQVTITQPFYLGMYLVTVGDFRAFIRATGYHIAERDGDGSDHSWRDPGWEQSDEHPVACVSWHDARAFCDWLSQKEHRPYRLPTEAEWEYACRAGSTAAYCYGPDPKKLADHAWYRDNAEERAHPVGRLKANRWGLFDMHGNLLQWCEDYYDERFYQKVVLDDPHGPAHGGRRVLRGASWNSSAADCRCARRTASWPTEHRNDRGFRVVLVPREP
jgi:formylglycine-generating enzyme required for sulfatase activity/tRNA A-37 threonylcarbamoyl transferase component Bud32